ncbi:MAG: glycosyltransferase family 39 protein, partial [Anaerolineae bacterium]|nr:glycosyltransferase family 39 protein [Anaerolineae bacterium]
RAGWIGLAVLVFDPNILAHGRLDTNDIGVTALGTLGLYLTWRSVRSSVRLWPVLVGFVLGLTCLSKSSGVLWLAAIDLFVIILAVHDKQNRVPRLLQALTIGLIALLTIWAAYGFDVGVLHEELAILVPAPVHWGTVFFQTDSADQRLAYALGKLKMGGWWWYFPLAWALKTPIPLMLVLLAGLLAGPVYVTKRRIRGLRCLLPAMFAALYSVVAIIEGPNIGYRHLLPIQPIIVLLATLVGDALLTANPGIKLGKRLIPFAGPVLAALFCWYALGTLASTPNEIAYFNLLAGPAENKHRFLISSNLDWGQMMKQMAFYLQSHSDETTYVAYSHPAPYPIPASAYLPPHPEAGPITAPLHPPAGRYLIGATSLHIPSSCCGLGLDGYAYFRNLKPDDTIGGAILVYNIAEENTPTWLVQCGTVRAPLSSETMERGFERPEQMRQVLINCNRSWLYPAGAGVVAFAADDDIRDSPFAQEHLAFARLSYQQPAGFIPEPFVLYESAAQPAPDFLEATYAAEAETPPDRLDSSHSGPYTYGQGIEFLGASMVAGASEVSTETGASTLELVTWWRITDSVPTVPFSIMAHLVTSTGMSLSIADGLDIAPTDLWPTDIFAQRHAFELPEEIKNQELWLRTGLYQLSDLARWRIDECPGCDAIFVRLEN